MGPFSGVTVTTTHNDQLETKVLDTGEAALLVSPDVRNGLKTGSAVLATPQPELAGNSVVSTARSIVASVGYSLSDVSFVYPSTHSDYFGEEVNKCVDTETNVWGHVGKVVILEVKPGAGSAVLGALALGELATVFTASDGLCYFHSSIRQMVKDRLPAVFHVEARSIDSSMALLPNQLDVLALRQTGAVILSSNTVQEAHDIAVVAHIAAMRARVPVVHFFDGARTASEIAKLTKATPQELAMATLRHGDLARYNDQRRQLAGHWQQGVQQDMSRVVDGVVTSVSSAVGMTHHSFEYMGAPDAEYVVVTLGNTVPVLQEAARRLCDHGLKVGVVNVRLYRPWCAELFLQSLPTTTQRLCVIDNCTPDQTGCFGLLYQDVVASVYSNGVGRLHECAVLSGLVGGKGLSRASATAIFHNLCKSIPADFFTVGCGKDRALSVGEEELNEEANATVYHMWAVDGDTTAQTITRGLSSLASQTPLQLSINEQYDMYLNGGVVTTHVVMGPGPFEHTSVPAVADVVVIRSLDILNSYDVLAFLRPGGKVLLDVCVDTGDLMEMLPAVFRKALTKTGASLLVLDAAKAASEISPVCTSDIVSLSAVVVLGDKGDGLNTALYLQAMGAMWPADSMELAWAQAAVLKATDAMMAVDVTGLWGEESTSEAETETKTETKTEIKTEVKVKSESTLDTELLAEISPETPELDLCDTGGQTEDGADHTEQQDLPRWVTGTVGPHNAFLDTDKAAFKQSPGHLNAWHAIFAEEYGTEVSNQPREKGAHIITVTVNRRVTPDTYGRNIFHLEFDIGDSGLHYNIGDALGVHGHNNEQNVKDFMAWYGLKPDDVVTGPVKGRQGRVEAWSVERWLTQHLDIFGRPAKRFYEQLADFASDPVERDKLRTIVSVNGKDDFKQRVEETQTYADLLMEFPSAHPSMANLLTLIPRIKPRHYSIASSMKVHSHSVHLLVVLHDWTTPSGKHRVGQCSPYMAALKPGAKVLASVRPSVMGLPEHHSQPVVMSGLGTGMAPFRAFLQERAYHKSRGVAVGPMVLYLGSRARAQEYLYGEELEAYYQDGLLTRLGLAFSRDQPHKVYIQHKMQEDAAMLNAYLNVGKGHFYLCGPTWPASDVRDAIVNSFVTAGGMTEANAALRLNQVRREGRYVLEVY